METKANLYDTVVLKNVDSKDFLIQYNISDKVNGIQSVFPAGKTLSMPRFLADHIMPHMINQILDNRGVATNNINERTKLAGEIFVEEQTFAPVQPKSFEQQAMEKAEEMNQKPSELDMILAKRKSAPANVVVPNDPGLLPPLDENGQVEKVGATTTPVTTPVVTTPVTPTVPNNTPVQPPTRSELYKYAENTLKMDMNDKKTLATYENMSVPDLIKELDYHPEEL